MDYSIHPCLDDSKEMGVFIPKVANEYHPDQIEKNLYVPLGYPSELEGNNISEGQSRPTQSFDRVHQRTTARTVAANALQAVPGISVQVITSIRNSVKGYIMR